MKKVLIAIIAFIVGASPDIHARETQAIAVPMWHVDMSRMIVDQIEEYLNYAADVSNEVKDRRAQEDTLFDFFIGRGAPFYIANEYFNSISIKSHDPSIEKTSIMPLEYFFDEISTKNWPYKVNFELVGADYYVLEVESVKDLGDNEVLCSGTVYKLKFEVNRDKSLRTSNAALESWDNGSVRCEKKLYNDAPEVTVGETLFLGLGDAYVVQLD